ncbi:acyl-CoA dehydrogenase family protein [Euzebya tangerina]|uniref:acyl-CoA dehydrogenase family protein n=1 Tax=Euzebya tangerina TaxID=591198 RepID=UPI000E3181A9|nr:acyl-CoA dehydrogenase family protein [Euzebya tangerina]
MDFRDTAEEASFRKEVAGWIEDRLAHIPHEHPADHDAKTDNARWWQEQLADGGYLGLTWPEQYGGKGMPIAYEAILNAESARRHAPFGINGLGVILAGPTILVHGTEEQKAFYLPRILNGDDIWCQGFSEPGAGSDLAGLSTRAEETGDGWVVNGQKVWTSFAHAANRCMLLARTTPQAETGSKHEGISYLLADTDQIDIRPLVMINGDADFNEMFLSDVHVPQDRLLGQQGGGWKVALTTLGFERGSLAFVLSAEAEAALEELTSRVIDAGLADEPDIAREVGRLAADVRSLSLTTTRQMSALMQGETPGGDGSAVKLAWAQTMQAVTRLAVRSGGDAGVTEDGRRDAGWISGFLRARGNSVEGGTDEVQRSIIAERVLGLPKSR